MHVHIAALVVFLLPVSALAQSPDTLPYQGRLVDAAGTPLTAQETLTFTIHPDATTGAAEWSETHVGVPVSDGYFNVQLGTQTPFGSLFDGSAHYLQVAVGSEALLPRQPIGGVPYAHVASRAYGLVGGTGPGSGLDADLLDGQQASEFAAADDVAAIQTTIDNATLPFNPHGTFGHVAAAGMCSGMVSAYGYGRLVVVRSNGVSCNSACDTLDGNGSPYTNYYCYGSVGLDTAWSTPRTANQVVAAGWYGNNYCDSTNGMNDFCCCKSNYVNTKG